MKETAVEYNFSSDLEMLYLFLITRALNCNNVSNQVISLFGDEYQFGLIKVIPRPVSPHGGAWWSPVKEWGVPAGGWLRLRGQGGGPREWRDRTSRECARRASRGKCLASTLLSSLPFPSLDSIAFSSQSFHRRTNNPKQLPSFHSNKSNSHPRT